LPTPRQGDRVYLGGTLREALMSTGGHALECPEQDAQCPQACGAVAPRRALAEHVDRVCPLSLVSCTLPGAVPISGVQPLSFGFLPMGTSSSSC
jgi:hypothetical protein